MVKLNYLGENMKGTFLYFSNSSIVMPSAIKNKKPTNKNKNEPIKTKINTVSLSTKITLSKISLPSIRK